jgi:GcrA cell cycle regulator
LGSRAAETSTRFSSEANAARERVRFLCSDPMQGEEWNAKNIALLRLWWSEGATAAVIALRLGGLSRSAVLGKIFRLRLQTGDGPRVSRGKRKSLARQAGDTAADLARRRRPGGGRRKKIPEPPAPSARGVTLLDLKSTSCRWPFGRPGSEKFHFCGVPEADLERGIPYCARHMRRAYHAAATADAADSNLPEVTLATRTAPR